MINRLPENELLKQVRMQHAERLARVDVERQLRSQVEVPLVQPYLPESRQPTPRTKGSWSTVSR